MFVRACVCWIIFFLFFCQIIFRDSTIADECDAKMKYCADCEENFEKYLCTTYVLTPKYWMKEWIQRMGVLKLPVCVFVCWFLFRFFFCSSSFTHVHTVFPLSIFNDKEICAWSVSSSSSSSISNWVFDARGRGGLGKNQTCNTPHTVSVQIKALNWNVYSIKWRPTG